MNSSAWMMCGDPYALLISLPIDFAGVTNDLLTCDIARKLRLFGIASVYLYDGSSQFDVLHLTIAEKFADDGAYLAGMAMEAAHHRLDRSCRNEHTRDMSDEDRHFLKLHYRVTTPRGSEAKMAMEVTRGYKQAIGHLRVRQADALRDLFGDPWTPYTLAKKRPACTHCGGDSWLVIGLDDMWCRGCQRQWRWPSSKDRQAWATTTVLDLANSAYSQRLRNGYLDNDRLAILADALEEGGYPITEDVGDGSPGDDRLLLHLHGLQPCRNCLAASATNSACELCNGQGKVRIKEHFPGCWALDLIRSVRSVDFTS